MEDEVTCCICEEDVKDYRFKELRKIDFGDAGVSGRDERFCLLCTSNHFGLTFVGCKTGVYIFKTAILYEVDKDDHIGNRNVTAQASSLGPTHIPTPAPPIDIGLSCDSLTLSVCLNEGGVLKIYFYDTRAFSNKGKPVLPFCNIAISTDKDAKLSCLKWNPAYSEVLVVAVSTGVVCLVTVKDDVSVPVTKAGIPVNTVCWSPKGKQFALGLKTGEIIQCAPKNFEEKRRFKPHGPISHGAPVQVTDLYWLSTYEFVIVYTPHNQNEKMSWFVFMNAPKDKPPYYHDAGDIYYMSKQSRTNKFYFSYIPEWGTLTTCSTNSIDTSYFAFDKGAHGVVGDASRDDPDDYHGDWWKWELEEMGRAEPPLDSHDNETYSVGVALDLTSQELVHISETIILPGSPLFLLFTDHGVLCPYTIVNTGCSPDKIRELIKPANPLPSQPVRQPSSTAAPSGLQSTRPITTPSQPLTSVRPGTSQPFGVSSTTSALSPFKLPTSSTTPTFSTLSQGQNVPSSGPSALFSGGLATRPPFLTTSAQSQPGPPTLLGGSRPPFGPGLKLPGQGASLTSTSTSMSTNVGQPRPQIAQIQPHNALASQAPAFSQVRPTFGGGGLTGTLLSSNKQGVRGLSSVGPTALGSTGVVSTQAPVLGGALHTSTPLAVPTQRSVQPHLNTIPSSQSAVSPFMSLSGGKTQTFSTMAFTQPSLAGAPPSLTTTPLTGISLKVPQPSSNAPVATKPPPTVASTYVQSQTQPSTLQRVVQRPQATPQGAGSVQTLKSAHPNLVQSQATPVQQSQVKGQPSSPAVPTLPKSTHSTPSQARAHPTSRPQDDTESLGSNQELVEARFAAEIQNEIDRFSDEINALQEDLCHLTGRDEGDCDLGSMEDLFQLIKDTEGVGGSLSHVAASFKKHERLSDQIKDETLKGFEMYEEARAHMERKNDSKYASLLKVRPLDSYSTRRLNDVRAAFLQVSRAIDEVNSQLDTQLERKYEERRQRGKNLLKAPSIQTVYSTLRDQHRIIRLQSVSIFDITQEMKKLRLIPKSWQPAKVPVRAHPRPTDTTDSMDNGPSSTPGQESLKKHNNPPPGGSPLNRSMGADKMEKLRECLGSIKHTPSRKIPKAPPLFRHQVSLGGSVSANASGYQSGSSSPPESPDGPSSLNGMNGGFLPSGDVSSAPFLETPMQPFFQTRSLGTVNPQSLPPLSRPLHYESNLASLESLSQASLASQSTQYSHKPEMIVSPERNAAVLTRRNGYREVNKPETPISRESPGPEVVASPQGHLAFKCENGYTGYTKTDSRVEAPQRPSQETQGTVHWGSPSPTKPVVKDQLPPKGTAYLAPALTGVQPPFLSSPRPLGDGVELGELRRTAPHGDLTQIKYSHGGTQDETRLVPNTSLSVPNIAPAKPEEIRPASVQKTVSPFSSNSTPHMLFGGIATKTESTPSSKASENPTPSGAPTISATSSLLMSKTSESVSQTKGTATFQVSSLSSKDTTQPGAPTTTTTSGSLLSGLSTLGVSSSLFSSLGTRFPTAATSSGSLLANKLPSFTSFNAKGASGLPPFASSGTPSFSLGLTSGGSTTTTATLASKPFTFNSAQTSPKPPTSSVATSTTGPSLSSPFVFGGGSTFSIGSKHVSKSVSLPSGQAAPTVTSSGILGLLSTGPLDKGDQKFKEISKQGANGTKNEPNMPVSSLLSGDTSREVHSDAQLKKDQTGRDTSKSIPQINKTLQSGQTERFVKEQDSTSLDVLQPSAAPPSEPVQEAQQEGTDQHLPTGTEVTSKDVSGSIVTEIPTTTTVGSTSVKPSSSVSATVTESSQERVVHAPPSVLPAAMTTVTLTGHTLRTSLSVPASVSLATSTVSEKDVLPGVLVGPKVELTSAVSGGVSGEDDVGTSGNADAGGGDIGASGNGDVIGGDGTSGNVDADGGDVGGDDANTGGNGGVTGASGGASDTFGGDVPDKGDLTGEVPGMAENEEMMGDIENDMEPVDDSTGQNTLGSVQPSTLNMGFGGLGARPSTNVTANPFGTPSTQPGASGLNSQLGLMRSSALGTGTGQPSSQLLGAGLGRETAVHRSPISQPAFGSTAAGFGSPPSMGTFGQVGFGSAPSIGTSTAMSLQSEKIFGSGGGGGMFNSQAGGGLSFGGLAQSSTGSVFSGMGSETTGSVFGGMGGGTTGSGFGGMSVGSTGSGFSGMGGGTTGSVFGGMGGGTTSSGFGGMGGGGGGMSNNAGSFSGTNFNSWRS